MKLLLENWKRYIKEELRPEDYEDFPQKEDEEAEAYLGNPKSVGEFIYRAFREELEKQPDDMEAQLWSDRIVSDANSKIKKQFPNVKYLGHGVFRTAFTLNKNLIIKVNQALKVLVPLTQEPISSNNGLKTPLFSNVLVGVVLLLC